MTNFNTIVDTMFRAENKAEYMNELSCCSLLIIDELGLERSSEYALGIIFDIIDHRYRSGKPLITTTNLPLKEIKENLILIREESMTGFWSSVHRS